MTIEPDWLAEVVELTTGRACDAATALALATILSDSAEVLPWLVLRHTVPDQSSLADDAAIMAALRTQADQIARPQSRRSPGFAVSAPLIAIDRAVCEDVARADLAEEVHGLFVRRHAVAAQGLDHAYRYRIGHPVDR